MLADSRFLASRVLIATLRQNGHCPCTRCFVTQEKLGHLGTPADLVTRSRSRKDDEARQVLVGEARRLITQQRLRLGHDAIEELLFPQSLIPIEVDANTFPAIALWRLTFPRRMPSPKGSAVPTSIYFPPWSSISYTSSRSACSKGSSYTSSESTTRMEMSISFTRLTDGTFYWHGSTVPTILNV